MTSFPSSAVKKKALMKQVNVYCQCRLPYVLEHMKSPGNEVAAMVSAISVIICTIFLVLI